MAGHVFVARSDLRRIAVDAWLLPCGIDALPLDRWRDGDLLQVLPAPPDAWRASTLRTLEVAVDAHRATPWLTHVGGDRRVGVDWYMQGVRAFLDAAAARLAGRSRLRRPKPLVGLPVVGTGAGGAHLRAGDIIRAQLEVMRAAADQHDIDCVLVTWDGPTHAAAQAERRRLADPWADLDAGLRRVAVGLATRARHDDLVLFVGAGVSAAAGLPLWSQLLDELATDMDVAERDALRHLDPLDQAQILERRHRDRATFTARVAGLVRGREHSLAHALLAGLPSSEVVTTNYDTLFEQASEASGRPVAVLPWNPPDRDRWVLKLHGSLDHPEDIVLTREDYLRYGARRGALAGVVQALLVTRHVLFVGFGLADDNFHRIADAVRQAVPGTEAGPRGTAIMLSASPLLAELWRPDLQIVPIPGAVGDAGRRLEILLDRVLADAHDTSSHLLDPRYDALLSGPEREVQAAVAELARAMGRLSPDARNTDAFRRLRRLLATLGA